MKTNEKSTKRQGTVIAALLSGTAILAACGGATSTASNSTTSTASNSTASTAPKVINLTMGSTSQGSTSAISFLFWTVLQQMPQFYKQVGLNVTVTSVQMGEASQLVQSGSSPVLEGSGQITVAQGYTKGATDVKAFLGELQKPAYLMVTGKGITNVSQITTLGVPSTDSASAMNCEAILSKDANFTVNDQYKLVLLGTSGARVAAVQAGKVSASCEMVPYPQEYQAKYGMKILASAASVLPYFGAGVYVYNTKWAQNPTNHEALVRLAEAYLLADKWAFDPANKSQVEALVAKTFNVAAQYAQVFYNAEIGQQLQTPDGYIPIEAANGDSQAMVQVGLAKTAPNPSQYYDWSILQTAAKNLGMTIRTPSY